jgi:hypothetical protein
MEIYWRIEMFKKMAVLVAGFAFISGCGHISGGVAPSNIPLAPGSYKELGPVRGISCVYYLLGIIPLCAGNETKNALAVALIQKPETIALINVTADTFSQHFIVYSRVCTQVDGIAVVSK